MFFDSLLDFTDDAIRGYVLQVWERFNDAANDWLTGMMVLFVVIMGYLLLIGRINLSLAELFPKVLKLFAIFVLVTNVGLLVTLVFNLFTAVPEAVATFLVSQAGETEANINGKVDLAWQRGMTATRQLFDQGYASWPFGLLVGGVTIALVVYVTFVLMLAKLAVAVLLAVAPFFIVLYLFDTTRPVFQGWLQQLISFSLIPVFLYALLALVLGISDITAGRMAAAIEAETVSLVQIAPYAATMLVTLLLTTQVMSWAAGVGGGFSLSTLSGLKRAAEPSARWASERATRALKQGMGNLASRLRGRGRGQVSGPAPEAQARPVNRSGQSDQNSWESRQRRERSRQHQQR